MPYEVRVSAKNVIGEGPRSEVKIVRTAEGSKLDLNLNSDVSVLKLVMLNLFVM